MIQAIELGFEKREFVANSGAGIRSVLTREGWFLSLLSQLSSASVIFYVPPELSVNRPEQSPTIILIVASVLAGIVAVWTAIPLAAGCLDAIKLRNPVTVEASILEVERRMESMGDGTKELVFVTYAYHYEDRRYESRTRRLTLFSVNKTLPKQLEQAMRNNETVPCYIARTDPALSVFSLDFSVAYFLVCLIFPLGFGSVSTMATWSLVRNRKKSGQTTA